MPEDPDVADVELVVELLSLRLHGDIAAPRARAVVQRAVAGLPDRLTASELGGLDRFRRVPGPVAVPPVELDLARLPLDVAARRVADAIADALTAAVPASR